MDRRAFVLGTAASLAGCSAFPRDRKYPSEYYKPQLLFEWTWKPDPGELTIEVVEGNPLTAENTAELFVHGVGQDEQVVWAARDGGGRAEFPVGPGDSLTVAVAEQDTVQVAWSEGSNSMVLDAFHFTDEPATAGTTEDANDGTTEADG